VGRSLFRSDSLATVQYELKR